MTQKGARMEDGKIQMNDFTLYQIKDDYLAFANMLAECSEDEIATIGLSECLEQIKDSFEDKAINIIKIIRSLEANAKAIKEASKKLAVKAKRIESKVNYISNYLRNNMIECNIKKIESPELTVLLRNNSGSVIIDNENIIPEEYFNIKEIIQVDKMKIKADYSSDNKIAGCHIDFTPTLQVK